MPRASCPETEDPAPGPWVRCTGGSPTHTKMWPPQPSPGVAHVIGPVGLAASAIFLEKPSRSGHGWGSPSGLERSLAFGHLLGCGLSPSWEKVSWLLPGWGFPRENLPPPIPHQGLGLLSLMRTDMTGFCKEGICPCPYTSFRERLSVTSQ